MICRAIPYEGNEPYIFLSYCHKDRAVVYPLFEQMVQDGYRVWYDDGNNAGDEWPENIAVHLEHSHICLAFVSEQSSISHNCKTEISFAIECQKKLVPVVLENFHMPLGMRMQLSFLHYLKKTDFPTDSALLNKIYEAEGFQDCKGAPGAMRRKSQEEPEPAPPAKPNSSLIRNLTAPPSPVLEASPAAASAPAPVQDNGPTAVSAPAPIQEDALKKHLKVKPVSLKKKKDIHSKILPESDPAPIPTTAANPIHTNPEPVPDPVHTYPIPEPVPEPARVDPIPKPVPEPVHAIPIPEAVPEPVHTDPVSENPAITQEAEFPPSNPSDLTVVSTEKIEDEQTVHEYGFDEKTVCDHSYKIDDEKTVRMNSTNIALLLQPSRQKAFLLKGPQTKIGRHPAQCDVVIEGNDSVSKHHANIIQTKQKFYLSDEGSSNGTFLKGEQLESKKQFLLDNPAIFQLNDEILILISGLQAKKLIQKGSVSLLINEAGTALRIMESETLPLNRSNAWPDGKTLTDTTVHRAAHAKLCEKEDGIYLVDESPQNGTYLNESRLKHGEARKLTSGDRIRLGNNTVLEFVSITLKENM